MTATSSIVVMGPTAVGKTTIGRLLAQRLRAPFIDGDSYHPEANVRKMASGQPLTDEDRAPWLERLAGELRDAAIKGAPLVLACSALKKAYREKLSSAGPLRFVLLDAREEVLKERLAARRGHFMPPSLLQSQLAALERPDDAIVVDAARPPDDIVAEILKKL